jgi:ubiquinone biosynthesis monooxygenase Coq7
MEPTDPLDLLLRTADNALRALFAPASGRRALALPPEAGLSPPEKRHAAGLMRVNHAGEIAAQALYHGQALMARTPETRQFLLQAADEEGDHLAWCEQRLTELGASPSKMNPFWYAGSFAIGAAAAAISDRVSLGFVSETERQVEGHLAQHLEKLPPQDLRSRKIVEQMQADEVEHGRAARERGGAELPAAVQGLMRLSSKFMTTSAYWV